MKKVLRFFALLVLIVPAIMLTGCLKDAHVWQEAISYGYDESGNYCQYTQVCSCGDRDGKTILVEAIEETNAVIGGTNITEIKNKNGSAMEDYYLGMSFDDMIAKTNENCASGRNTSFVQTVVGSATKAGLPISGDIKLTEDIVVGYNGNSTLCLLITDEVTIDLNGYSITQQCGTDGMSGYALFVVNSGATLNIVDSSKEQTGQINAVMSAIQVNGEVNLCGGTVKCGAKMTQADVSEQYFCVWTVAFNGGTFNLYDGKVETVATREVQNGQPYTASQYNFTFASYSSGVANIYGGEVDGQMDQEAVFEYNDYR